MTEFEAVLRGIVICFFLASFAYSLTRIAAIGYYKSKREHFNKIWQRATEEEDNEKQEQE